MTMLTPSGLRKYLESNRQATLSDLSIHFHSDPEAVKAAMNTWISKGKAEVSTAEPDCGSSCCHCKIELVTIYRWLDTNKPNTTANTLSAAAGSKIALHQV